MSEAIRQTGIGARIVAGPLICLAAMTIPAASQTLDDYLEDFRENGVAESALAASLRTTFRDLEYVVLTVGLIPHDQTSPAPPVLPVRVSAYSREDFCVKRKPQRILSSAVYSEDCWRTVAKFLVDQAEFLVARDNSLAGTAKGHLYKTVTLTYHLPRRVPLVMGGLTCVLSEHAQRYLMPARISDYPSTRHVLIVDHPHSDLEGQVALYKGLDVFFADNPALLRQGRTVFLVEGYPAGKLLSVGPLVKAEATPTDALIRQVLGTYLISGDLAYEWKRRHGIPILGTEEMSLHRLSAGLWTEIQGPAGRTRSALWLRTVAARNQSMARTLLAQLDRHACPILFVGGRHLEPPSPGADLNQRDWERLQKEFGEAGVDLVRRANMQALTTYLWERKIGFYLLVPCGYPLIDDATRTRENEQYIALFRAQLDNDVPGYLRKFTSAASGVTVTPSPEAAAQVVMAAKSSQPQGAPQEGSEEEENGEGEDNNDGENGGNNGGGNQGSIEVIDEQTGEVENLELDSEGNLRLENFMNREQRIKKGLADLLGDILGNVFNVR